MPAPRKFRPPAAVRRLELYVRGYRRRLERLEHDLEELRAERDRAIRQAFKAGVPITAIAEVMGLSHQRISKIVRKPR